MPWGKIFKLSDRCCSLTTSFSIIHFLNGPMFIRIFIIKLISPSFFSRLKQNYFLLSKKADKQLNTNQIFGLFEFCVHCKIKIFCCICLNTILIGVWVRAPKPEHRKYNNDSTDIYITEGSCRAGVATLFICAGIKVPLEKLAGTNYTLQ